MSTLKTYDISSQIIDINKLDKEISSSGCIDQYDGLSVSGTALDVLGVAINNEIDLDNLVQNHDPLLSLAENKNKRLLEIDTKTDSLIAQGFVFDSTVFSLSVNAQITWLGLKAMEAVLTWPVQVSTKAGNQYELAQANLIPFLAIGSGTVQYHLGTGRGLKIQINAAVTQTELDVIVDNR